MAFTQAQITALEKAIATGATQVRYADRMVTYRSLDEMKKLLADMQAQVNGTTRTKQIRVTSVKGFE